MRLLPKIIFVNKEDKINKYLGLGVHEIDDGSIIRYDGTYHVFSDTIFIFNEMSTRIKIRALIHELIHAFAFRIPFHNLRETINWIDDYRYFKVNYKSGIREYTTYFKQFRDDYGRFEWIRPRFTMKTLK